MAAGVCIAGLPVFTKLAYDMRRLVVAVSRARPGRGRRAVQPGVSLRQLGRIQPRGSDVFPDLP
eukprot:11175901-Lingulodinium_polyedra.AAC.1